MSIKGNVQIHPEILNKFDNWIGKRDFTQRRGLKASQLIEQINIDRELAQFLLVEATYLGILKKQYVLFCPFCNEFKRYDSFNEIPSEIECSQSQKEYSPSSYIRNIFLVFDIVKYPGKELIKT